MNTQNILKYFGRNIDLQLDSSEYYDYELSTNYKDYNKDVIDFTTLIEYTGLTFESDCLSADIDTLKPLAIPIDEQYTGGTCDFTVRKRTELGWTLDFVFNKNSLDWTSGNTFYYWGIVDETEPLNYADNNLSFSFTDDGRIAWEAYRYSGYCDTESGYTASFYISSGQTPILCSGGTSDDFNLTITFTRYSDYYNCDLENMGGHNDLITGYTVTNVLDVMTGATEQYELIEILNKKWDKERDRRLGTLKIYLNGRPVYKLENWEEVIPSERQSTNGLYQIFGGGTTGSGDLHIDDTEFTLKYVKYFEEPLDFVHIFHHYITEIKPNFNIVECDGECVEIIESLCKSVYSGLTYDIMPTPTPTATPVPTPTPVPVAPVSTYGSRTVDRDTMNYCTAMEGWSPANALFGYTDEGGGSITEIQILTVPTNGTLQLNFVTTITENFIISGTNLTAYLTYTADGVNHEAYDEYILYKVKTDAFDLYSENIGVFTLNVTKCYDL